MLPSDTAPKHNLSIVIPVYNSAGILPELIDRLSTVLPQIALDYEVILVNDGSRDGSWEAAESASARYAFLHAINLMRNYGQHNALLCGIRMARYELIVTMDDDLQHPPEELPKLISRLEEGFDVVYGTPDVERHGIWRDLLSVVTKRVLATAMGVRNIGDISAFRIMRAELRDAFANYQSPHVLLDVLLSWGTSRFGTVRVKHDERKAGKSNYTLKKLVNQALLIMTGFSTAPLRIASLVGLGFTLFGVAVFAFVIVGYLRGGTLPGFTFLASIIALFSGAQMFAIGIIGEYLARIFNRSSERPTYVVRNSTMNEVVSRR